MKALVKTGVGYENVSVMDVQEPLVKSGQVKIKVHATGICGTDLHIVKDEYLCEYPVIMGHEYSGEICELGENVSGFHIGDRVVSITAIDTCGSCTYCNQGLLMLCDNRKSIGSGVNGAFSEYIVIPHEHVYKIPENISMDEAALCEPLACVVRSVIEIASVNAGDTIFISGPGTIGQLVAQLAKVSGAIVVISGLKKDKERLELALKLGSDHIVFADESNSNDIVNSLTDGNGFDLAFECAGNEYSSQTCLEVLKKTGQYMQVGLFGKKIMFDHDLALKKEVSIKNSYASEKTSWERALKLLSNNQINMKPLISAKFPLEKWKDGFQKAFNGEGFKILIKP